MQATRWLRERVEARVKDEPDLDDRAGRALAAARAVARRLPTEVPELAAGIGVAYGPAVAGNIGDERRFEEPALCEPCATVLGISALSMWRRFEEEDE